MVSIFISKVPHLGNTVYNVDVWCSHTVKINGQGPPVLIQLCSGQSAHRLQQLYPISCGGDESLWAQHSHDFTLFCNLSPDFVNFLCLWPDISQEQPQTKMDYVRRIHLFEIYHNMPFNHSFRIVSLSKARYQGICLFEKSQAANQSPRKRCTISLFNVFYNFSYRSCIISLVKADR